MTITLIRRHHLPRHRRPRDLLCSLRRKYSLICVILIEFSVPSQPYLRTHPHQTHHSTQSRAKVKVMFELSLSLR